jgi:2-isopropylmalate synthase
VKNIQFFDTTLRDGEQGIGFTLGDEKKLAVLKELDSTGLRTIEIGMVTTTESINFFHEASKLNPLSQIAALCRLKFDEVEKTITALEKFPRSCLNLLAVGSEFHLRDKLRIPAFELGSIVNLCMLIQRERGFSGRVMVILEDASRGSAQWIDSQINLWRSVGVTDICFADTVGCLTPAQVRVLFDDLMKRHPDIYFSVHFHNDLGLASANSLAAIEAGVREVQVTLGGIGERCGNAAIEEIVAALELNPFYQRDIASSITLATAVSACDAFYRLHGSSPNVKKPIIGEHAFATCAGIHQDGILKSPHLYEMFDPAIIGRKRKFHRNRLSSRKCLPHESELI